MNHRHTTGKRAGAVAFALAFAWAARAAAQSPQQAPAVAGSTQAAQAPAQPQPAPQPAAQAPSASAEKIGAATCLSCHADHDISKKTHSKAMLSAKGVSAEQSCETCHGPGSLHAAAAGDKSNPGYATIKNPKALGSYDASEICLACHKQKHLTLWGTSPHKQAGLSCVKCHSIHEGEGRAQLAKDPVETCLSCHKTKRADIQLASHHPLLEGKITCAGCHNPHGGVEGNLKGESLEDTCLQCHAEKGGPFLHEHPPVVESCAICHKPHGSANDNLLKQPMPFLCLRCHKWPHQNRTGGGNAMSVSIFEQRGRCTDCHREIHGSDRKSTFKD
jgi:DmsE family decaheme c-type cytochrome